MSIQANEEIRINQRYRELQALAAAAQSNPGEERSRDHDTTPEYDAYAAAIARFIQDIAAAHLSSWEAIHAWCKTHEEGLGDVDYPGVHATPMDWDAEAHTVSKFLLRGMHRRFRHGPESTKIPWATARIASLLSDKRWLDCPMDFFVLLLALRGVQPEIFSAFYPEPLHSRLMACGYAPGHIEALQKASDTQAGG